MFSARHNKLSGQALEGYGLFIGETDGVWSITTYLEKGLHRLPIAFFLKTGYTVFILSAGAAGGGSCTPDR